MAMAASTEHRPEERTGDADLQAVLDALGDPDCRAILQAVGPAALTASECSEACDLPLSTTYRKLELLTATDLVREELRIRRDGKHANQYRRRFEAVTVDLIDADTFDVSVRLRGAEEGTGEPDTTVESGD